MVGTIKGGADVGSRSSSGGLLGSGGRGGATSLGAAGNASGRAADEAHQAAFERQHAAAAECDHQTSVFHEALDLCESGVTDSSSDVVGVGRSAETWRLSSLLKGHGGPTFGQAFDLFRQFEVNVSVNEDVDAAA